MKPIKYHTYNGWRYVGSYRRRCDKCGKVRQNCHEFIREDTPYGDAWDGYKYPEEQIQKVRDEAFERGYTLGYLMCKSDMTGKGFITGQNQRVVEGLVNAQLIQILADKDVKLDKEGL